LQLNKCQTPFLAVPVRSAFIIIFLLFSFFPVSAQNTQEPDLHDELLSFVGLKLDDLIMRFGIPQTVFSSRGEETWQDDVVFVYDEGDFYIYRDRVWQIGLKTAYGLKTGDGKAVALLVLGDKAQDEGDYLLYPLPGSGWPLSLRINFNSGRISAIFVYRPDY